MANVRNKFRAIRAGESAAAAPSGDDGNNQPSAATGTSTGVGDDSSPGNPGEPGTGSVEPNPEPVGESPTPDSEPSRDSSNAGGFGESNGGDNGSGGESPYEGKRGRHPADCQCSRHGGNGRGNASNGSGNGNSGTQPRARRAPASQEPISQGDFLGVDFAQMFSAFDGGKKGGPKLDDFLAVIWKAVFDLIVLGGYGAHWALDDAESKQLGKTSAACMNSIPGAAKSKVIKKLEKWVPWLAFAAVVAMISYPRYQMTKVMMGAKNDAKTKGSDAAGQNAKESTAPIRSTGHDYESLFPNVGYGS